MPIHDLGSDVLFYVLALLDVFTIITLSRVNHDFHAVSSTKQLWLSVLRELSSGYLIDPPAADVLETISTAELIEEVKRAVVGPRTWSPASSAPPIISRRINFSLTTLRGESIARLLQDGRHVLFYKKDGDFARGVECWDMLTLRRVWGWASSTHDIYKVTFDFHRGAKAVVAAFLSPARIIILEACFKTGDSRTLLEIPLNPFNLRYVEEQMSRDFYACRLALGDVESDQKFMVFVNLRAAKFVVFHIPTMQDFALIPGYLLLASETTLDSSAAGQVRIYSVASFGHLWRPVNEFTLDDRTSLGEIPSSAVNAPGNDLREPTTLGLRISVAESVVHDDTYELTVDIRDEPLPRMAGSVDLGVPASEVAILNNNQRPPKPWVATVSRYNLALPSTAHSSLSVPQPKTILRYQNQVPRGRYTSHTSAAEHWLSWYHPLRPAQGPREAIREILVYAVDSAGIHSLELPMPDAEAPTRLDMARTGDIMATYAYASRIVICRYL
ncbi:hypothetical protein DFH09DRAFT_1169661 [Mycena vulgaris]|nr:hypothetical protein DFH09DRAFT_1169661 [Mycena vulgaris]